MQDPSLTCTFFDVPLDYQDPAAGNGRLADIKLNATGERQGSVFLNPGTSSCILCVSLPTSLSNMPIVGGPGGSGVQTVFQNKELLLALSGGIYDVVSWDPRGVGNLTM